MRLALWRALLLLLVGMTGLINVAEADTGPGGWTVPEDVAQDTAVETASFGQLICDENQNLHMLWVGVTDQSALLYYQGMTDRIWEQPKDVLLAEGSTIVRLSAGLAVPTRTIHAAWEGGYLKSDLLYTRAPLNEASLATAWAQPELLALRIDRVNLAVDAFGTIHIVYGSATDGDLQGEVSYLRSEDNGETWSAPVQVFADRFDLPVYAHPEISVDNRGRVWVGINIRSQEYGVYSEVGYVRSEDDGKSWSAYELVDRQGTTFQGVAILAPYTFGEAEIHLTWHDPRRMHKWSVDGGETWTGPIEIMSLGAAFGGPNQLVKDSAGRLFGLVATGAGVYSAQWNGQTWGAYRLIDDRSFDPHGQEVVVCEGNQLHVIYYDRTGDNRLWYSTFQTDAPHIEPHDNPAPTRQAAIAEPEPHTTKEAPSSSPLAANTKPQPAVTNTQQRASFGAMPAVLVGVIPSAILVMAVIIANLSRRRR